MDAAEPPRAPIAAVVAQEPGAQAPPGEVEPNDRGPNLELGVAAFFMVGGGAGSYAGASPFLAHEIGDGVFLRPALSFGESLATNLRSTFASVRVDTCVRVPGRYASRNGLQLDLCAGPDVGVSLISGGTLDAEPPKDQTLPFVDIGPSAALRAEVGRTAFWLRALAGVNVARGAFTDNAGNRNEVAPLTWRLEIGISWDADARVARIPPPALALSSNAR